MKYATTSYLRAGKHAEIEKQTMLEKRRQAGISFPAPRKQEYLLIIRLDVREVNDQKIVSNGLKRLCTLFENIDSRKIEMEDTSSDEDMRMYPLSRFNFTATIGFGETFFRKLNVMKNCPKNLYEMPPASELGDNCPYVLPQTDMILQLASNNYSVNKMVLQNDNYLKYYRKYARGEQSYSHDSENGPLNIMDAINGWAKITDVHTGFHRTDGRNLMGFYDGISNPHRLVNNIWIPEAEGEKELANGTYMVFQKIEHNLTEWQKLDIQEQEKWVGRSKATGLLLGTLSINEEKRLVSELNSTNISRQKQAMVRLSQLIDEQRNPRKNFFDPYDIRYMNIYKNCPISSHARKANPRQPNAGRERFIFRRGCLYMQEEFVDLPKSGILFISFQNDIKIFEDLKRKLAQRLGDTAKREQADKTKKYFDQKILVQNSFDTLTLGGGYYFIPPIIDKRISYVGQQFFSV